MSTLLQASDLTVYDLLPEIDSYMHQVEENLRQDGRSWNQYQRNPVPFVIDVINDFGSVPAGFSGDYQKLVKQVAKRYCGR